MFPFSSYPPVPVSLIPDDCSYTVFFDHFSARFFLYISSQPYYISSENCVYFPSASFLYYHNSSWIPTDIRTFNNISVVYSSSNIYDELDNSHYIISSVFDSCSTLSNTISSTTIISVFFRPYLPLVSVVLAACVCFIGFRKAWTFLIDSFRGA